MGFPFLTTGSKKALTASADIQCGLETKHTWLGTSVRAPSACHSGQSETLRLFGRENTAGISPESMAGF